MLVLLHWEAAGWGWPSMSRKLRPSTVVAPLCFARVRRPRRRCRQRRWRRRRRTPKPTTTAPPRQPRRQWCAVFILAHSQPRVCHSLLAANVACCRVTCSMTGPAHQLASGSDALLCSSSCRCRQRRWTARLATAAMKLLTDHRSMCVGPHCLPLSPHRRWRRRLIARWATVASAPPAGQQC